MKGSRGPHRWDDKRVQFQEPYYKMPKSSSFGPSSGMWKPVINVWEKQYCESVGVSWDQVCDNNNELEGFEHILKWDDSGALEAFQSAKQRYWAHCNGLHCDIPLPGPDLYTQEIDWNYQPQENAELPERHHSSSPEERRRQYWKRGYRGRRKNLNRRSDQAYGKSDWTENPNQVGSSISPRFVNQEIYYSKVGGNQNHSESKRHIDRRDYESNGVEPNQEFFQNFSVNATSGWGDLQDNSWNSGPLIDSGGGEAFGNTKSSNSAWGYKKNTGWDSYNAHVDNDLFGNEKVMDSSTGWVNQAEPMRDSTVTSRTGWTDAGKAAGDSFDWGNQVQDEGNGGEIDPSGWTVGNQDFSGKENETKSGWDSKPVRRQNFTDAKETSVWDTGNCWRPPINSQDKLSADQWGNQFPPLVPPQSKSFPVLPTQMQWQSQETFYNSGSSELQHYHKGGWIGRPVHSFPQVQQPWYQAPICPQNVWHPGNANQGYWQSLPHYKEGYATQHHYAPRKEKDPQSKTRWNQRSFAVSTYECKFLHTS